LITSPKNGIAKAVRIIQAFTEVLNINNLNSLLVIFSFMILISYKIINVGWIANGYVIAKDNAYKTLVALIKILLSGDN